MLGVLLIGVETVFIVELHRQGPAVLGGYSFLVPAFTGIKKFVDGQSPCGSDLAQALDLAEQPVAVRSFEVGFQIEQHDVTDHDDSFPWRLTCTPARSSKSVMTPEWSNPRGLL